MLGTVTLSRAAFTERPGDGHCLGFFVFFLLLKSVAEKRSQKPSGLGWTFDTYICSIYNRLKKKSYLFIPVVAVVIKTLAMLPKSVSRGTFFTLSTSCLPILAGMGLQKSSHFKEETIHLPLPTLQLWADPELF